MMKKISSLARKVVGLRRTHYIIMIIGLISVLYSAAILQREYNEMAAWFRALFFVVIGIAMVVHSVWFLEEILGAFGKDSDSNE